MGTMFLQEVEATVLLADVRDFAPLAQQLGPVELGLALSRFYEHIGGVVEKHHGKIVKFIGDGVLAVFIGRSDGGQAPGPRGHRERALAAIAEGVKTREAFLEENTQKKLPMLDYAFGAASGSILAGELGTEKLRFYDVLGAPVNQAFRLTALATRRSVTNLVAAETYEGADKNKRPVAVEQDMVEMGADNKLRLFKIEG